MGFARVQGSSYLVTIWQSGYPSSNQVVHPSNQVIHLAAWLYI